MSESIRYNNDNYYVTVCNEQFKYGDLVFSAHYAVVNNKTDVVEARTPALPEAIQIAVQYDVALKDEPWNWMYKSDEEDDFELPGENVLQ